MSATLIAPPAAAPRAPLEDCTKQALQERNVVAHVGAKHGELAGFPQKREAARVSCDVNGVVAAAAPAAAAATAPTANPRRTHNPYPKVIPDDPEQVLAEMQMVQFMQIMVEQQRRAASCSMPSSPLMLGGAHGAGFGYGAACGAADGHPGLSGALAGDGSSTTTAYPHSAPVSPMMCRRAGGDASFSSPARHRGGARVHAAAAAPPPTTTTPPAAAAESSGAAASAALTFPSSALTKVYQNGRPVPTLKRDTTHGSTAAAAAARVAEAPITAPCVATVQFHHPGATGKFGISSCAQVLGVATRAEIVGMHVIVDGDRGVDLGRVVRLDLRDEVRDKDGAKESELQVQRAATPEEVAHFNAVQPADEQRALHYVIAQVGKVLPSSCLTVEAAAFQFDRQKLTVWYRAPERVYFVPLLKVLNQQFKCRIWMVNLDERATSGGNGGSNHHHQHQHHHHQHQQRHRRE